MGYTITGALANPDQSPNTYFIDKLGAYGDPRVCFIYCCSPFTGQPSGNPFGIPTNSGATYVGSGPAAAPPYNVSPTVSTWGILQGPTQPSILVSGWESLFLQAEAVYRGLLPGGDLVAEADYEAAITDDFLYLQVYTDGSTTGDPADFARAYYAQNIPDVGWAASPDKLRAIITQKYISLCFTNVEEAWTDYRRTGFPADLPLSTDPGALYPRVLRLIYPQSEYDANAASVAKEGAVTPVSPKNILDAMKTRFVIGLFVLSACLKENPTTTDFNTVRPVIEQLNPNNYLDEAVNGSANHSAYFMQLRVDSTYAAADSVSVDVGGPLIGKDVTVTTGRRHRSLQRL